jgi:TPR repeat protein
MIVIHGLAAGSTLTEGRALETGSWQLTARELHDAVLRPPQGFAGAMELGLELRLPNDNVADRKTLHLEWTASAGSQATRPAFVIRQLGSDEVAALLKRGEGFIASGDLASARLVLQRAAEAGEAQAALSLAGTFDPIVLDKLGLQGQKADIEKARIWYQRAQELGSAAAPRRLQLLAGYDQ